MVQWFIKRKHTCGSLRLCDAGKCVTLVGWIDKKSSKFVQLSDGYGSTQILIENIDLNAVLSDAIDSDLLLVRGRVLARPQTHITRNCSTGEIELYAETIKILSPEDQYTDETETLQPSNTITTEKCPPKNSNVSNVNEFTYRTHSCGELRGSDVGKTVTLCGWLEFARLKRFFTLRDGYGHTQILIPGEVSEQRKINRIILDDCHLYKI